MRRLLVTMMIAAGLLHPASASAQGWRWLEKLSGPGDFTGYEVDFKLFCNYDRVPSGPRLAVAVSVPCLIKKAGAEVPKDQAPSPSSAVKIGEGKTIDLARRAYSLGVGVSYLRGRSDLPYAPTDEGIDRTIQILAIEGFFDHRLSTRVDYGVAFGPNLFLVPTFDDFTRFSLEPRITVKLFDLRRGQENDFIGTASLRVGALLFFKEFVAADFGAIGPYRSGSSVEWGPSVRLVFDFDRNPLRAR
jgi:hypothetical protein